MVVIGQTFVALNFSELSSHFPVAGSIYQWSKRLSHRTLGWFTGWFYFWAGVLTVTAVAATVPLVVVDASSAWISRRASPIPAMNNLVFWGLAVADPQHADQRLRRSVCCPTLNNIGVAAEILGMVVFAMILLLVATPPGPLGPHHDGRRRDARDRRSTCRCSRSHVHEPVRRLRLRHRRDLRRGDHRREPPGAARRPHGPSGCPAPSARSSCSPSSSPRRTCRLRFKDPFPIATAIKRLGTIGRDHVRHDLSVRDPRRGLRLHARRSRAATARLMFSMGRDRRMPLGGVWASVNSTFKTPANAAIAVGVIAAIPFLVTGQPGGSSRLDRRHGPDLPELPDVQHRRAGRPVRGWPRQGGLVQARQLGHRDQHPRDRLGRS